MLAAYAQPTRGRERLRFHSRHLVVSPFSMIAVLMIASRRFAPQHDYRPDDCTAHAIYRRRRSLSSRSFSSISPSTTASRHSPIWALHLTRGSPAGGSTRLRWIEARLRRDGRRRVGCCACCAALRVLHVRGQRGGGVGAGGRVEHRRRWDDDGAMGAREREPGWLSARR